MNWTRFGLTVLAAGVVSSLTDWFFMGDLLYRRYNKHPEIWRYPRGQGETKAIAWSSPLPFLTCAVFAFLCLELGLHSYSATLKLALGAWLIGPLPLIISTALFLKLQPAIAMAYSLGWLVKLVVAAATVVWILR
jgi:hypothetical protein